MNILFLNAYYAPEQISFTHLEQDLIEKFIQEGNHIHVVCPTPTRGISAEIAKSYQKAERKQESTHNGQVTVRRFSAPQEGRNPLIRAIRYFWCNLRTYGIGKKYRGIDVVFAVSTPPTQGYIAGKVAKKLKCPLVYSLQDIFPDSLVTTGLSTKGSILWKIGRALENKTYRLCKKIIVISEACRQNLLAKGVSEETLVMIPNWIDTEQTQPIPKEQNTLFEELNLSREKFTVLYAGNFGAAQGAEVVLQAAELLRDVNSLQFVIFGGGAGFDAAQATVKEKDLVNVTIHPLLPLERVSEVYSLGDVALITCKAGVGNSGMPSKTWSIMACNTPIIASFDTDSDLAEILRSTEAGICVEPENAEELSRAILNMQKKQATKDFDARSYVCNEASKERCTEKYFTTIKGSRL